jgi:hypothetical protein
MVNPGDLVNSLVNKMRLNPDLVKLLGGKPENIYVYRHSYSRTMALDDAVYQMAPGTMMVVWEGTYPASFNRGELWRHQFGIYVKASEKINTDATYGTYNIWEAFINGVPVGDGCDGQRMLRTEIHPDVWFDTPSITPQAGRTAESTTTFEYFKISVSLTQKGLGD